MADTDRGPLPSTAWNKAEVHPNLIASAGTPAFTIHDEATLRIERALARFALHPEVAEASHLPKPEMEPEWLHTDTGECHWCGADGPRWCYQLDPGHSEYLFCQHPDADENGSNPDTTPADTTVGDLCPYCLVTGLFGGTLVAEGAYVSCAGIDGCRQDSWLSKGRMPWVCASCWKLLTAIEAEHVANLKEEY